MLIHFLETITIIWQGLPHKKLTSNTVIAIFIGPLHLVATAGAAILVPSRPCRITATHLGIGCPLMKYVSTSSSGELRWHGFQKDRVSVWRSLWWGRSYVPRVLCSPAPMFPCTYVPRYRCSPVQCSPVPMFPGAYVPLSYIPRYLCSPVPIFPCTYAPPSYVPQCLCSPVPMFPRTYVPPFHH